MQRVSARSEEAHRRTVESEIGDIARFLQETLGRKLVAYMAGVKDSKLVGKWARGEVRPRAEAERRLRTAFQVFQLLLSADSAHVVRAWFVGLNPQLDDQSPANTLREGRLREVLVAAKAYLSGA